jgi:UDP-2,3-diacylglucosamine hydrolase
LADDALPRFAVLDAPASWRSVECISDLHLHERAPATFAAWQRYMSTTQAGAVFILGDLFEAWPGDDAAREPGFDADCAEVLRTAARERPVFFMHGNRDFMVGAQLMASTGVTLLDDPTVLSFAGTRWLLSHGDLLCLDDVDYLRFRAQVRDPAWQQAVLAKPLAERRAFARAIRSESEARHQGAVTYADVDAQAASEWLRASGAGVLVHGHTHRPGEHALPHGKRIVLSDWDAGAQPPRLEVLRLTAAGPERVVPA